MNYGDSNNIPISFNDGRKGAKALERHLSLLLEVRAGPGCRGDIDPKTELSETCAGAEFINLAKGHLDRCVYEVFRKGRTVAQSSVGRTIFQILREGGEDTPNPGRIVSLFF